MKNIIPLLPRIVVAAGLLYRHGSFLAAQRPDNKPLGAYWELPGGKAEDGETPEMALCRELAEELGINVLEYSLRRIVEHDYLERGFRVALHFYDVKRFSGEPIPKEGQNLRWVTPKDLAELVFLPADAALLDDVFGGPQGGSVYQGGPVA